MTAPAAPAHAPPQQAPVDVGALWKRILEVSESSPRDQAMVDSFEAASYADGLLVVRRTRGSGAGGTAILEMLTSVASRAAGRAVRVRIDAEPPVRRLEAVPAPAVALPGRAPSLRDDPVAVHPLVREVSALFDATIVRIEAAGSLNPSEAAAAAGTDAAEAAEPGHHGDDDV